ncbi:MAG: S-layer family protein [Aphanothece sp. CMT-3BRIN-NPC111]|jgi:filamentous hemagglutinin family protein|nr:S-layer family protein [Aphanothece sp. CMT-3BRIN-NPC111]
MKSPYLLLNLCLLAVLSYPVKSEIVPDSSLINSTVNKQGNIIEINNGTLKGKNLFHSFDRFSIDTGATIYFNNPMFVNNIFSRVTGSRISNIDGIIKANGYANLFLINPNGILFGENARLNLKGSFLATTASEIKFADGTLFSAFPNQSKPLLTVSVPVGLRFGQTPGEIRIQGTGHLLKDASPFLPFRRDSDSSGLQVQPGKTLALVGGNISLEGGIVMAPGGRIELGSVGNNGYVSLNPTVSGWNLGYEGVSYDGDIRLSQRALVDASGFSGGSIGIFGGRVSLANGSMILIQNQGFQPGGDISINTSFLEVSGTSSNGITPSGLVNETVGAGNGGNIAISAKHLLLQEGGVISTRTFTSASGGNLTVNAPFGVQVLRFSPLNPSMFSAIVTANFSSGKGGNLTMSTGQLAVLDGAGVGTGTFGSGQGGNITLNVTNSIELKGASPLLVPSALSATTFGSGNAGFLTINTKFLEIENGAAVSSSALASGNAGSVTINASRSVELSGTVPGSVNPSLIVSAAYIQDEAFRQLFNLPPVPSGASGDVTINTPRLNVINDSQVSVRNDGTGNAGTLHINTGSLNLDNNGGITAATASGEGGNIVLQTQQLQLRHNSFITATAGGTGTGGNLTVDADTLVALENSSITADAIGGRGGNIQVTAKGIFRSPDSAITATSARGPQFDGVVDVRTLGVDVAKNLTRLEGNFVSTEQVVAGSCLTHGSPSESSFTITGTGGLPTRPEDDFTLPYSTSSIRTIPSSVRSDMVENPSPARQWKLGDPVVEAQGLYHLENGQFVISRECSY